MSRLLTALKAFWEILRSADAADRWRQLPAAFPAGPVTAAPAPTAAVAPPAAPAAIPADAVFTLVLLQREGRLVDFLQESLDGLADAQIGAAARQIHADCQRVLRETFGIEPVRPEDEGTPITLSADFDPRAVRLTGSTPAPGSHPSGILRHRGWRVTRVAFPQRHESLDPSLICPADLEVTR